MLITAVLGLSIPNWKFSMVFNTYVRVGGGINTRLSLPVVMSAKE